MIRHAVQKSLRLFEGNTFDSPNNLVLSRRSIQNKVWSWNSRGTANDLQCSVAVTVEVQIDMANFFETLFGSAAGAIVNGIHSNKDVGARLILFEKDGLKLRGRNEFCFRDPMKGLTQPAIVHEYGNVIGRRK